MKKIVKKFNISAHYIDKNIMCKNSNLKNSDNSECQPSKIQKCSNLLLQLYPL